MAYGTVKVDAIQTSTKTVQVDDLAASADLGTAAAEDVGTSAGNVVQLDGSARLPAVDGSQLTNLPGAVMDLDGLTDVDLQTAPPADGEALVYDAVSETWIPGAAGATAAGSANEIQYNDGSSGLAASADLTWDDTAKELGVGGDINLDDGGTYSTTLQMVTATANRVISFPDATGTVGLVAGSSSAVQVNTSGALAGYSSLTFDPSNGLRTTLRFGYAAGAGGTVTQATNKSTGVTLNKPAGQITMNAATLAAGAAVSFTLTNDRIDATDLLIVNHSSGGTAGAYMFGCRPGAGTCVITVRNITAGNLSEAVVIGFAVLKSTAS